MRAFLFTTATMISIGGLRTSICLSPQSAGTPLRSAKRTTTLAAMMSRRRSDRSAMREVRPRRSLPPVERCTGISPTQAVKSRPERNVSTGGANASIAMAISGSMPGTLFSRRAVTLALARVAILASRAAVCSCRWRNAQTSKPRLVRVAGGMSEAGSSINRKEPPI